MRTRRQLIASGAVVAFAPSLVRPARAAPWPDRPVHMVVPLAAGGPTHTNARGVAAQLSKNWEQKIVIENKSGAGTNIGHTYVAHSPPHGYTPVYGPP